MLQRTRTALVAVGLLVALIAPVGAAAGERSSPLVQAAKSLGLSCSTVTSSDGVTYDRCTGEIPSFDGLGIDTDLSLPSGAGGSLPTILMLHGWGGDKTNWESDAVTSSTPDKDHWNNVWFVSRGWAVVNPTARGFGQSCGMADQDANCSTGWTHLADRSWEIRDWQTILGKLVDAGIADGSKLASTGGSYGGGQSWLLATAMPWTSPGGATLRLAAAVPKYPWTDLLYSLVPNGRQTDSVRQRASHAVPFGVPKESYESGLYALGRSVGGRYNTTDPTDYASALDADFALVQSGEPYDAKTAIADSAAAFRGKSAYFATRYLSGVSNGSIRPVPVLSIQGWTDPLFPPGETLQMFRKVLAADRSYPITIAFGDVGHPNAQNPGPQWTALNALGQAFLDHHVLGVGPAPASQAYAFVTTCPAQTSGTATPIQGPWDALSNGSLALSSSTGVTTTSAADTAADGAATDPIANSGCLSEPDSPAPPGVAEWSWPVPAGGATLLGLPDVRVGYALSGTDATIALKLWDVGPDGTKTLVTRGAYRLSTAAGDPATGTFDVELFGNCWTFPAGHTIQMEVAQTDAPFLRPDNLPSSIALSSLRLTLPIRSS